MNIGLDMMGGDLAPLEAIKGVGLFLDETKSSARLFLTGDEQQINSLLDTHHVSRERVQVIHAPQVIGMHEHPTRALKEKPDSSISLGFQLLASNQIDAFISAGNTGAMMVGTLFSIKTIPGVHRPTISTIVPKVNGATGLLLDVGLNADCKAENLNQFAILGSLYAESILGIPNPRIGLLNVGEEDGKGNLLTQASFPLLKSNKQINFIGNVEGRDIFFDKADILVCEGFTGNIILKMAESIYQITQSKNIQHPYFDLFNFEIYGGTPVLGVTKPVVIGHGISRARAFKNMIALAEKIINTKLLEKITTSFQDQ